MDEIPCTVRAGSACCCILDGLGGWGGEGICASKLVSYMASRGAKAV